MTADRWSRPETPQPGAGSGPDELGELLPLTSMAAGSHGGLAAGMVVEATRDAVPVNACGGVASPGQAWACLRAGARTVQVYTGLIYRGPGVVGELTSGLARELRARADVAA